jgi:hypothetical protein
VTRVFTKLKLFSEKSYPITLPRFINFYSFSLKIATEGFATLTESIVGFNIVI